MKELYKAKLSIISSNLMTAKNNYLDSVNPLRRIAPIAPPSLTNSDENADYIGTIKVVPSNQFQASSNKNMLKSNKVDIWNRSNTLNSINDNNYESGKLNENSFVIEKELIDKHIIAKCFGRITYGTNCLFGLLIITTSNVIFYSLDESYKNNLLENVKQEIIRILSENDRTSSISEGIGRLNRQIHTNVNKLLLFISDAIKSSDIDEEEEKFTNDDNCKDLLNIVKSFIMTVGSKDLSDNDLNTLIYTFCYSIFFTNPKKLKFEWNIPLISVKSFVFSDFLFSECQNIGIRLNKEESFYIFSSFSYDSLLCLRKSLVDLIESPSYEVNATIEIDTTVSELLESVNGIILKNSGNFSTPFSSSANSSVSSDSSTDDNNNINKSISSNESLRWIDTTLVNQRLNISFSDRILFQGECLRMKEGGCFDSVLVTINRNNLTEYNINKNDWGRKTNSKYAEYKFSIPIFYIVDYERAINSASLNSDKKKDDSLDNKKKITYKFKDPLIIEGLNNQNNKDKAKLKRQKIVMKILGDKFTSNSCSPPLSSDMKNNQKENLCDSIASKKLLHCAVVPIHLDAMAVKVYYLNSDQMVNSLTYKFYSLSNVHSFISTIRYAVEENYYC